MCFNRKQFDAAVAEFSLEFEKAYAPVFALAKEQKKEEKKEDSKVPAKIGSMTDGQYSNFMENYHGGQYDGLGMD